MSEQDIIHLNRRMDSLEKKIDAIATQLSALLTSQAVKDVKQEAKYRECLEKMRKEFVHQDVFKDKWHSVFREVRDEASKTMTFIKNYVWIVYIAGIVFLYIVK